MITMSRETETPTTTTTTRTTTDVFEVEDDDTMMETFTTQTRCCAIFPCFGSGPSPKRFGSASSPSVWERLQQTAETENRWWGGPLKGMKKIREWSEIVAGPKWKTFIRRFNRSGKNVKYQYDPLSYALNFDEGQGHNGHFDDDDGYFPDFSSRFASVPSSCKSSMDLGKNVVIQTST
ncbi:hypothetical protein RND81_10G225700 [Saponaria officinalis]|uniref:Uncharacterized protein n=1 Tax=Saponaria officinalis TaxID=3572 RepID=A0AAW1I7N2_SAPOF